MKKSLRLLVALAVLVVALVAWLALGTRRENAHDANAAPTPVASAQSASHSETDLDPVAAGDAPTRNVETVSPANVEPASAPACRVRGRVVDPRGAVVPDARVTLRFGGDKTTKEQRFESTTGSDGRFLIETPPPAKDARLRVSASELLSIGERAFGSSSGQELARLAAGDNDLGDIALGACGAVAGRVITESGLPARGARLSIRGDTVMDSAQSGDDGRYRIGQFSAGRYAITVEPGEWLSSKIVAVDVVESQVAAVPDIVVQRASTITGSIVDESGAPVAKLLIQARTQNKSAQTSAKCAADGSFTLYLPKPEPFMLEIRSSGEFMPWGGVVGDPRFTFEPGTSGVRVVLTRAPGMTFRVIDAATRAPIERFGIRVAPRDPPGTVNTKHMRDIALEDHTRGEARLPVLGDSIVAVTAPGHADLEIPFALDAGSTDVQTIALSRASGITGRVYLAKTPVARASVQVCRDTFDADGVQTSRPGALGKGARSDVENFPGRTRTTETDDTGMFQFTSLAPGTYALSVEAGGAGKRWVRMLVVPREDSRSLDVELEAEAILRGVVITGFGESPIGFEIQALDRPTHTIQAADGKFELRGLSAGPFSLYWNRPNANSGTFTGDPKHLELELRAGEVREVVIDASQSAPCTLRVRVEKHGQPSSGVPVSARVEIQPNGKGWRTSFVGTTDQNGLVVGRVEGSQHIRVEALSAAKRVIGRSAPLDSIPGGEVSCSIDVAVGTLTIELPATISIPENGRVTLVIDDAAWSGLTAMTGPARGGQPVWSTNRIEFGEFPVGSYDAHVKIQRFVRDTSTDNPKAGEWPLLREVFDARIEIKEGAETRVVVP